MEESKKFYSQRAISITTFFGGPLAAGILIRQNFLSLDKEKQGKDALYIGIISTILIFGGLLAVPEHIIDMIPNALIPALYTAIIYLIVEKTHGAELKSHKENNGDFYPAWNAVKIGAISMIGIIVMIASMAFIAGDFSNKESDFDVNAYDEGISEFFENEAVSLHVFNEMGNKSPRYIINELKGSIDLWTRNQMIIDSLMLIKNLPDELKKQNTMFSKYCELRILHFEYIRKAYMEDTDIYDSMINQFGVKIDNLIAESE